METSEKVRRYEQGLARLRELQVRLGALQQKITHRNRSSQTRTHARG